MDIQAIENLSNSVAYTSTPGYTHITVPNCMREKKNPESPLPSNSFTFA